MYTHTLGATRLGVWLPVAEHICIAASADPYKTSCWILPRGIKIHRPQPTGFLYPCELDTRLSGPLSAGSTEAWGLTARSLVQYVVGVVGNGPTNIFTQHRYLLIRKRKTKFFRRERQECDFHMTSNCAGIRIIHIRIKR